MASLRSLLLLLSLIPALLAPIGLRLERCKCSGEVRLAMVGTERTCRAQAAFPSVEPSCCHAARPAERGGVGERVSECGGRLCECNAAGVPDLPQHRIAVNVGFEQVFACVGFAPSLRLPPVQVAAASESVAARGPPAPDAQRSLPLLL